MEQPVNTPTPPAPAPQPAPAAPQPPAPVAPQAPEPVLESGGETNEKIDWVGWGFMALGVAAIIVIIWKNVQQAKQSKKFADTQESLEQRIAKLEGILNKTNVSAVNSVGNLMMSF